MCNVVCVVWYSRVEVSIVQNVEWFSVITGDILGNFLDITLATTGAIQKANILLIVCATVGAT
jgi:hypothetical protein